MSSGNRVDVLFDGERAFPRMEALISRAERNISLFFYSFDTDETGRRWLALLRSRAEAGVAVRLLVDGFGSQGSIRHIRRALSGSKVEFSVFLPSRLSPIHAPRLNFINHRKILVVDEQLAFTGGMNVGNDYERKWRDLMLEIEGEAARALHHVFLEDWYFATGRAVLSEEATPPSSVRGTEVAVIQSGPDTEPWIMDAYFVTMTQACQRIWLATPYFIPSTAIMTALRTAAGRGVDVRIVVPQESDVRLVKWASRSYYRGLVDSGVRIFEYDGPMLHAKAMVVDAQLVALGSANIDSRSFRLSFEVSCFVESQTKNEAVASWLEPLFVDSTEMTSERLSQKPWAQKLAESAAHLLSPLL